MKRKFIVKTRYNVEYTTEVLAESSEEALSMADDLASQKPIYDGKCIDKDVWLDSIDLVKEEMTPQKETLIKKIKRLLQKDGTSHCKFKIANGDLEFKDLYADFDGGSRIISIRVFYKNEDGSEYHFIDIEDTPMEVLTEILKAIQEHCS